MSNGGSTIMFIGGAIAVVGIGYYMHKAGYFNQIFDAINKAIDDIKNTKPLPDGGGGGGGCSSGKIKCKDGKCDTQANCNKQANCKAPEYWDASKKKCVTKAGASLALAYVTPVLNQARIRAYRLY